MTKPPQQTSKPIYVVSTGKQQSKQQPHTHPALRVNLFYVYNPPRKTYHSRQSIRIWGEICVSPFSVRLVLAMNMGLDMEWTKNTMEQNTHFLTFFKMNRSSQDIFNQPFKVATHAKPPFGFAFSIWGKLCVNQQVITYVELLLGASSKVKEQIGRENKIASDIDACKVIEEGQSCVCVHRSPFSLFLELCVCVNNCQRRSNFPLLKFQSHDIYDCSILTV